MSASRKQWRSVVTRFNAEYYAREKPAGPKRSRLKKACIAWLRRQGMEKDHPRFADYLDATLAIAEAPWWRRDQMVRLARRLRERPQEAVFVARELDRLSHYDVAADQFDSAFEHMLLRLIRREVTEHDQQSGNIQRRMRNAPRDRWIQTRARLLGRSGERSQVEIAEAIRRSWDGKYGPPLTPERIRKIAFGRR